MQGKRIKIQAHYECRRHDTPAKPRVKWGQSPIWNPGYTRTKSNIELRRSGTIRRAFVLRLGSAAPLGLNKCVPIISPGRKPWAMQEYRPYRAPLHLPYHFTILMRLPCPNAGLFDLHKKQSLYNKVQSWVRRTRFSKYAYLSQWVHALTMISTRK